MKKFLFSLIVVLVIVGLTAIVGCGSQEADQGGAEPASDLDAAYDEFQSELNKTMAYLTADAMMEGIIGDLYRGADIYELNISDPMRYNNQSVNGWMNGFNVSTTINNSTICLSDSMMEGQDYSITVTTSNGSIRFVSINACVYQIPGPSKYWENQSLSITTWQVEYY